MSKRLPHLIVASAAAAVGGAWLFGLMGLSNSGCGSDDPKCGNGVQEMGEECDDGNTDERDFCRSCFVYSPPRTTVTWDFNKYVDRGFSGDNCNDTEVFSMQIDLNGPTTQSLIEQCSKRQVVFFDLQPGDYTVSLTPLGSNGEPKVKAPVTVPHTATANNTQIDINVPFDSWLTAYKGLFIYRLKWGGASCSAATPAVATQALTLKVNGQLVGKLTDMGQKTDGTDKKPCRELAEIAPQSVADVPFGPATFEVVGEDSAGNPKYRKQFDTFVGVGQVNPPLEFNVDPPPTPMFDAAPAPDAP